VLRLHRPGRRVGLAYDRGLATAFPLLFKSLVVAYVCWLFFAVYYFYFKKPGMNIVLWITGFFGVGEVWWIVDFFRMPSIRRDYNESVARQALQTLSLGTAFNYQAQQSPNLPGSAPGSPPVLPEH
jgi:hypothetical protein